MTTKEKPKAEDLLKEEQRMDKEIERLEAEARELETPARLLTWEKLQEDGAVEEMEKRERRRGILPRLIQAAKIKRLQILRERYERESAPLPKEREEAHAQLEKAKARRLAAEDEENEARYKYSDAFQQTQALEKRLKAIDREIRELRGEQQTNKSSAFEWAR